ncbi:GlxA family transcriptional regulator [Litoribrevibacter albus]|uniref:AraC family transcriptional regulator n=1 Tax=Litoribrevibacter albus TaxID=1473156 RepID=A0AA37SDR3_9GAMM|nr:helix-turn-helix domain-containing protein [Litoribrevibacter albus]GLQ33609.1 AraC family transcriptional regulator [Litoribrevibacter albus]
MQKTRISILIGDRCPASGIFSVVDTLIAANYTHRKSSGVEEDIFPYQLIGRNQEHRAYNGFPIGPVTVIDPDDRPDILIVPGMLQATTDERRLAQSLVVNEDYVQLIRTWHQAGTVVVGVCHGNFLVASSGIASGKALTTHWLMDSLAQKLFPEQVFDVKQLVLDHGDIISVGGASAISKMVLYLIERFHSRELALQAGRLMLIEPAQDFQTPFSMFLPNQTHGDPYVSQLQSLLEQHFQDVESLPELMTQVSISERQLTRRFKQATGETPIAYLQRLRIEFVRRGLETSNKQVNSLIWESGYEDVSSFRRLFKKTMGLTMTEYRQRYGLLQRAVSYQ